jgi:hypothetical protein
LLAVGRAGTACHVERIVRGWRRVDRIAEARETAARQKSRAIHVYQDEDGMVVVCGRLTPEAGAALMQALAAGRERLYQQARGTEDVPAATSTMAQQQADALALLAETALHHGLDPGAPGERYQVVVHIDAPVLANPDAPGQSVLEGGTHVSAETSRRLACDATRVIMRHDDDGRVVERRRPDAHDSTSEKPFGTSLRRSCSCCSKSFALDMDLFTSITARTAASGTRANSPYSKSPGNSDGSHK